MAIKITQIKPEGAQKSAPSAKDYSGEKKGSSGSAVSGSSGRIQITKIPGAEKQRSIAASRKTTRETEHADELDKQTTPSASRQASKQTFGQRVLKGIESGLVSEGANLANLGGVATDRRGGTEMSGVYRRQAETLDKQIAALEKTLKDPTMTAQDIKETNEALAIARSEREKYGKVIESGEKTASSLYDTADKGYSFAKKLSEESTAGTKGIKKGALSIVPAATQIGLQTAERMVAPGMDVAGRALSVAGGNAADYRRKAGEQYDAEKATLRATVSALGVAAGGALSKGVNAAGLKLLRTAGKQNYVLPNIALGGASAVGYAAGETSASELSKAMTDEDYTPDWKAIGETALTAFVFGAISSAINAAAITGRNKKYMNELNDAAKERYDYAKHIIEDPRATAEQKAAGAQSVMDAVDKMRYTLDDLQVVGAQKEVDAMREFLLSIYGEMLPYTNVSAGGIGTGASGLAPAAPVGGSIAPVQTGGGMSAMQENAPTPPISPRAPGAAAVMQNTEPVPAPTVGQQNTMPAQPAVTPESAQGMGEGNLTPTQPNAAQGAAEGEADALDAGKRVNLLEYSNEQNAQKVEDGLKDGTLAVDAKEKIYRVNEDQHIDRRDSASVGERSVNAFQFDHPELHSYYADAAAVLQEEMSFAQKGGELIRRTNREAGDDEYIRTKRGVSERIARLLDDEGVRYDDIDRSLSAIIHNHGQENFAAAKRVELLLDDMLANGYTDIHGQHIAPNEEYIAAKKAIPGADMSEWTHEELPIYDMPEGRNGGIYGRQEENAGGPEPAEGTGQRADAVAAENDLHGGDRGRRPSEPGAGGAGKLRSTTAEGRRRNRELTQQRREIAWEQPLTSAAALGVQGGTSDETLHVLPEEDWDDELRGFSDWARGKGVKRVTMVTGLLQVETENGPVGVRGIINRESGEMVLRVDGEKRTASEIGKHEVGHLITEEENVRAFMETVRGGADWRGIYEVYERCYEPLTNGYVGMTAEERELYVWEEIMEDAYAGIDSYGQRASRYHEQAVDAIERAAEAAEHPASEPEGLTLRAVDEVKSRGPPEKYSYAGRNAENADLDALHEAERYEMQGVDAETIRKKTGWFRGADGKWRWEIDDSGMKLRTDAADISNYTTLGELVDAPALFVTYPDMKDMSVTFHNLERGQLGSYHRTFDSIELSRELKQKPEALLNSLIHEVQHAIQQREGFTPGANPKYWNRKLEEGYDGRDAETRREGARLREQYERMKANDPEFMRSMEELNAMAPTVPRGKVDMDTWEQVEPDPPEWVRFDERRDQLEEKYGDRVWDYFSLRDSIDRNAREGRLPGDLYRDTAGEIEARDAAARRGLTAEERRGRKPDTGDENTVFADGSGWSSYSEQDSETSSIKEQIENSREKLNAMGLVARASVPTDLKSKDAAAQWAAERLKSSGYKVDRQGYGDIYFSKKDMDKGLRYADTAEEKAALAVLPQVLKRGIEIGGHANHKGRTKQTITFAAPVELNGTRGNMAVVVNKNGNHYYAHRIVLPDGTAFRFSEEGKSNAAQELSRGVTVSGSLADTTSAASENSIPKDGKRVKYSAFNEEVARQLAGEDRGKVKFSAEDEDGGKYLTGLDDRSIEERKKSISLDEAINELYRQKGLSYRFYSSDDPMSRAGYAMFADEPDRVGSGYGGDEKRVFSVEESSLTDISDIKEKIIEARHNTDENTPWELEDYEDVSDDSFAELFDPEDIVDSAAAYDDESLVSWLWNNVLEPNDIAGVKTSDGAVAFSPDIIKRNLAAEIAFGRSNGDDVRFSAEGDGGEWDKELARMPQSVQEAVRRVKDERSKKSNMQEFPNLDAYLSGRSAQQAAEKAERLRDKGKDEFKGTEALEKLGVKIENSAGDYSNVEQLIANDRAAKTIQRETRKAIKRLGATPKEQNFALNIASGLYDEADIPATMNRGKVVELADYYSAEQSMSTDFIRQRRAEINENLQEKMKDLFDEHFDGEFTKEKSGKGIAPESGFALYHRTPQRSMRAIFGWKRGKKINEAIFEPVYVNEQERKRFVNRMHDEVRTFKGKDGKEEALTQRERALAQLSIEGKAVEEMVGKSEIKQQIIHAAENLLDGAEMKDTAQEFGLHGKEERELAQRYADWLETKRELDSGEADRVRVENAAAKYSGLYNEFYAAINDFLVAHGYEPIGFIKGYAPHFQPEAESGKLERALKAIGVDLGAEVGKLPASIAGLTKEFKPNKRYNPFFQHRNGKSTDYDIQKGFEKYVDYLSDVLYHTDDIMRTRAASKYFRKKYAPDEISAQIQQAEDLKFATAEEKELFLKTNDIIDSSAKMSYQAMNQAMEKYTDSLFDNVKQTTKYGDLVTWLDDYANKLAGKQLFNDRNTEKEFGRMSLNIPKKLVNAFARANVAGNLSSALNQTAQLPMIAGELGPKYVVEAIGDIASGKAKGGFADRSDFLTEKRGIRYLTSTKGDKFMAALFWPLERMDYLVSSIAVRGKYRKELAEGKSEKDALRAADRWGRDMMGSRSKGAAPLTFQSKTVIAQMVNLFQVEALNSWEHVTQDLFGPGLREMEEKLGKKEASRRLAGIIVGTLLGAFILNRVDEELYGGTPAQFDVLGLLTGFLASGNGLSTNEQLGVWVDDVWQKMTGERLFGTDEDAGNDKFNLAAAAEDTIYNISNDIPYARNVAGVFGVGDQTLPMPDLWGTATGIGKTLKKQAAGKFDSPGDFWSEVGRQLMGLVGDTVPGGRQLEKTAQGAETLARGGTYKGSGDNERLQYAVNPDFSTVLQAMLFGRNALSEARDFYAANDGGLSASQTRTYQELVDMGADREVVYDAIQKWRKIDKDDSLTDGEREAAQFELVRKLKLTNEQKERLHDDLSRSSRSYAAAQEAQKQGISAETYAEYKDATADLTADKDENGKAINGSKKAKVLDAIDKMQLSKKQKDWLYLDAGYSEKDIGKAPWNS
jgi:hypothetical protein|nr:MAG TPA: Large polyvalent protein associated domain 23 [Caudoviricetes sp.]